MLEQTIFPLLDFSIKPPQLTQIQITSLHLITYHDGRGEPFGCFSGRNFFLLILILALIVLPSKLLTFSFKIFAYSSQTSGIKLYTKSTSYFLTSSSTDTSRSLIIPCSNSYLMSFLYYSGLFSKY